MNRMNRTIFIILLVPIIVSCGRQEKKEDPFAKERKRDSGDVVAADSNHNKEAELSIDTKTCIDHLRSKVDTLYYHDKSHRVDIPNSRLLIKFIGLKFKSKNVLDSEKAWQGFLLKSKKRDSIFDCVYILEETFDSLDNRFLRGEIVFGKGRSDHPDIMKYQFDTVNRKNFASNMHEAVITDIKRFKVTKDSFQGLSVDSSRFGEYLIKNSGHRSSKE